jgi:hypothetical protein
MEYFALSGDSAGTGVIAGTLAMTKINIVKSFMTSRG